MILQDIETGKFYNVYYDNYGGTFSCGWVVEETTNRPTKKKDKRSKAKRKVDNKKRIRNRIKCN